MYVDLCPGFAFFKARTTRLCALAARQRTRGSVIGLSAQTTLACGALRRPPAPDARRRGQVEAIVRPWRLPGVISALSAGGIRGVTAYEVKGLGAQDGVRERYQGQEFDDATLVSKSKVEIVCVASQVNDVVNLIVQAAQTGETGDGKVFISPVSDVIRIRTAEHGAAAERMKGGREDMTRAGRAASS